ncbi:hypothetical protein [Breoghania sp.]|uniref:hypothetical protein n=1 Tax=Breoghania sp. TaxID=2065378 RepID=UPI002AA891FE|nr:hypothetical protein [Breoghania sp.]
MEPIQIRRENERRVVGALMDVSRENLAFAITDFRTVERAATVAEYKLRALEPAERVGATARYRPDGPSKNSRVYAETSTEITIERRGPGWFLVEILETLVYRGEDAETIVTITPAQRNEIARVAVADFRVSS